MCMQQKQKNIRIFGAQKNVKETHTQPTDDDKLHFAALFGVMMGHYHHGYVAIGSC